MFLALLVIGIYFIGLARGAEITSATKVTVCCEKTVSGLYCQNVPVEECALDSKHAPTACESTSYCRPGYCFDSGEGTCQDKTSQLVCNANDGIWRAEQPEQCNLGCCVLGDQAAFVTLTRCKKLSGFLGLTTNYNKEITDEVECVLSVRNQDKGACVFESDLVTTCEFTTRDECASKEGEFFVGMLCSAEELGTNCGPTSNTMCVPGKDEVYFKDTCGNPANIYDSSMVNNKEYWTNVKDTSKSCNPNGASINSQSCGNCNYLLGSICRPVKRGGTKPSYGDNICTDLNCKNTEDGNDYLHGESWCVYDDEGDEVLDNAVGSRFYKHICINGEEVLEQCADFRQEVCLESVIETISGATIHGGFSQAACRVNRWHECTGLSGQDIDGKKKEDCENTGKRDCLWIDLPGSPALGYCVPLVPPGLKFWEGEEAKQICSKIDDVCTIVYEESLTGDEEDVKNAYCRSAEWFNAHKQACNAMGDCGSVINWIGKSRKTEGRRDEIDENDGYCYDIS